MCASARSQSTRDRVPLRQTEPHFIRCIKPNTNKASKEFNAPMTLTQLRYAGVFEAVAIRRSGYPFRMPIHRFLHWYHALLLPRTKEGYTNARAFKMAAFTSSEPGERVKQILAHTGQEFPNLQVTPRRDPTPWVTPRWDPTLTPHWDTPPWQVPCVPRPATKEFKELLYRRIFFGVQQRLFAAHAGRADGRSPVKLAEV